LALFVTSMVSLQIGSEPLPLAKMWQGLFTSDDSIHAVIMQEIRLPRLLISLFAGATLGLCGAVMQGLLQNPLASPGLLGSSAGAAFGAIAVLYFGFSTANHWSIPLAGMAGALVATVCVYTLAGRDAGITTIILAGVAINALASAGISLLLNLAPSPYASQEMLLWTLGDLTDRSMIDFYLLLPFTLLGWLLMIGTGKQLDALTLGEKTAFSMGINTTRLRWRLFIAVSLAVGAAVSATGMIGFIGLVVPHLLRPWVQYQPSRLLPVSALGGALMLIIADIGVRLIPSQTSIKVGVLTAIVGAPFFLHLIVRARRQYIG